MNARTAASKLFAVVAVSLIAGCAVQTGEDAKEESTGQSAEALSTPTSLPGPVTCDSGVGIACSFTSQNMVMLQTAPSGVTTPVPGCTGIYRFVETQTTLNRFTHSYVTSTLYSYDVAYCITSSSVTSWVALTAPGPVMSGIEYGNQSTTTRALPAAAAGYTYVRFDWATITDIKCLGGCPSPNSF